MRGLPQAGDHVSGYRIERELGRGGMGVVYLAEQARLRRYVALKLIIPEFADDDEFRRRFERESQLAASLDHPNIIPVYEAGEADGALFISMRFVEGRDLRTILHQERRLLPERSAELVSQLGAALDAAHAKGLVHRDVKPANVLVAGAPGSEHAYLTDFGLTKHVSSTSGITHTGQWVGTLDYVAPEQITGGPLDARVDVYSLGCVLFQTLTGQVPYLRDADVAKMYAHLHEPPAKASEVAPGVPPAFDEVIGRALEKDPARRYPSAGDLGRAAVAAVQGQRSAVPERSVAAGGAAPVARGPGASGSRSSAESRRTTPMARNDVGRRTRAPVVAACAALLVAVGIAVALAATGAFSGDSNGSSTVAAPQRTTSESSVRQPKKRPVVVQPGGTPLMGEWRGTATQTAASTRVDPSRVRMTITGSRVGDVVGTLSENAIGPACEGALTLRSATAGRYVLRFDLNPGGPSRCIAETTISVMQVDGDRLSFYESFTVPSGKTGSVSGTLQRSRATP